MEGVSVRLYDYAASANCYKARLLLALLEREYERVPVDIFAGDTLTEEFAGLNPARETPVLELDDGTCSRSRTRSSGFLPRDGVSPGSALERGHVAQWLFFEQERVMSGIGSARFRILTGRDSAAIPARLALGQSALAMLEAQLDERSYLVGGSCSIADLANFAYTHVAEDAGFRLSEYPSVSAWLDRVRALPGFVDDLLPYPDNARPGASRSIYDE